MKVEFVKMHGAGNDYVYIDCIKNTINTDNISAISRKLSDKHFGIGSDGIVLILPSYTAHFKMRMFNSDGSEANMCGNAIRCVAKYVYDNNYTEEVNINIETLSGIKKLCLTESSGNISQVEVDMGTPLFDTKIIPVLSPKNIILNEDLFIDDKNYKITCVSMGNPHCVVFVDELENLEIAKIGPKFENNNMFPDRINTEFVNVLSKNEITMRVWERGSGETLSCGTGACASVVACILNGFCNYDEYILIHLKGGTLEAKYTRNKKVILKGPAEFVYKGVIEI